jgi:pyridoxamine 5'-phosphate oxidase
MRSQKRPKPRSTNGALPQSSSPSLRFPSVVDGKEPIVDDDPFRVFAGWWQEENVPMVLATAGPTARAVVLETFDERGFVFWTSSESPKARALAADPRAALVWLWEDRQARVEGRVEPVADEENDRHWREREGKRQLAAFRQSEPVESREALLASLAAVPEAPKRPAFWRGYRVLPERFEFWIADEDYVHDRFEYLRSGDGWSRRRLQP